MLCWCHPPHWPTVGFCFADRWWRSSLLSASHELKFSPVDRNRYWGLMNSFRVIQVMHYYSLTKVSHTTPTVQYFGEHFRNSKLRWYKARQEFVKIFHNYSSKTHTLSTGQLRQSFYSSVLDLCSRHCAALYCIHV